MQSTCQHALWRFNARRNLKEHERSARSTTRSGVPVFECKLCTEAQPHRILQKSPIRFRLLTKPSLSFFYMCNMTKYPYLNKWPFLADFKTTTGECRDRWSEIAHFQGELKVPGISRFGNPISWSPSNISQHCPQRKLDSNSESFQSRKSAMSSPFPVKCQKIISDGQVNKLVSPFQLLKSYGNYVQLWKW